MLTKENLTSAHDDEIILFFGNPYPCMYVHSAKRDMTAFNEVLESIQKSLKQTLNKGISRNRYR